ncbi:MAG: hypothetical protein ACRED0_08465 [Gammaproteobacteria bacterium]
MVGAAHFHEPVCEMELRPGGAWRVVMRSPEGVEYPIVSDKLHHRRANRHFARLLSHAAARGEFSLPGATRTSLVRLSNAEPLHLRLEEASKPVQKPVLPRGNRAELGAMFTWAQETITPAPRGS